MAGAVEAVGADSVPGNSDGRHKVFDRAEFQRVETEVLSDFLYHGGVARRAGFCVLGESFGRGVRLEAFDYAAGYKLHWSAGAREVEEVAGIDERRAAYADVDCAGTGVADVADVVAELSAADNGVVAEGHALAFEKVFVGNELHLGYEFAPGLSAGREASRPGGCVLHETAEEGLSGACGVAERHSSAGVGHGADEIEVGVLLTAFLAHYPAAFVAHFVDVAAFVAAGRIAVVGP